MGIDRAMVTIGQHRRPDAGAAARRRCAAAGAGRARRGPGLRGRVKAHVRQMVALLQMELRQARDDRRRDVQRRQGPRPTATRSSRPCSDGFWDGFDQDPLGSLEFLENRIAPLSRTADFSSCATSAPTSTPSSRPSTACRSSRAAPVPHGQRGILFAKFFYEELLKLKTARRLDKIKEARELHGRQAIAKDEELQRFVKENPARPARSSSSSTRSRRARRCERLQAALGLEGDRPGEAAGGVLRHRRRELRRALPALLRGAGAAAGAVPVQGRRHHHHQGLHPHRLRASRST